jgi:hypothetical protein
MSISATGSPKTILYHLTSHVCTLVIAFDTFFCVVRRDASMESPQQVIVSSSLASVPQAHAGPVPRDALLSVRKLHLPIRIATLRCRGIPSLDCHEDPSGTGRKEASSSTITRQLPAHGFTVLQRYSMSNSGSREGLGISDCLEKL